MGTNIGQYAPVFLPGEPPSLTEKPSKPQSTGSQRVDMTEVILHAQMKDFFASGNSAPVTVEREGGTAAWFAGTLTGQSVQGHGLLPLQELWPYQNLFVSLL